MHGCCTLSESVRERRERERSDKDVQGEKGYLREREREGRERVRRERGVAMIGNSDIKRKKT